jgi:hypothetical protein
LPHHAAASALARNGTAVYVLVMQSHNSNKLEAFTLQPPDNITTVA